MCKKKESYEILIEERIMELVNRNTFGHNVEKRKLGDNAFVLGLKSFCMMDVASMILMPLFVLLRTCNAQVLPYIGFSKGALDTFNLYMDFAIVALLVLIVFYVFKGNRPMFKILTKEVKGNTLKNALLGLLIGGGMNAFCILCAWLHGDVQLSFSSFSLLPLVMIAGAVLIQSGTEELVCRGYLYQKLLKSYKNPVFAIVFNAVFFAAIHLTNPGVSPFALANIVVSGILFGMMVYYLDSFWCAACAHAAWNFTQNIIFGLPNSGKLVDFSILTLNAGAKNSLFYNTAFGIEATVIATLVMVAVCVGIYLWAKKHPKQPTDIWA